MVWNEAFREVGGVLDTILVSVVNYTESLETQHRKHRKGLARTAIEL
jgi:hypothetical protein